MSRLNKEERKEKRAYLKNLKRTRKELIKQSNRFGPWDEHFLFEYMGIIFQSWIDYYSQSYSVVCMEVKDAPSLELEDITTRLDIAKELKRLYDDFYGCCGFDGKELMEKEKALYDYMLKYIHFMWD